MKINSSTVCMDTERSYMSKTEAKQTTILRQARTGSMTYSQTSFLSTYREYAGQKGSTMGQYDTYLPTCSHNNALFPDLYMGSGGSPMTIRDVRSAWEKLHEEFIKRLEELLERIKNQLLGSHHSDTEAMLDLTTGNTPGTIWKKTTYESASFTEQETTSFHSTGSVVTENGHSITFDISMEMSRSFFTTAESLSESTEYILTDPLIIRLDNIPDTLDAQTWFFDLDGDGKSEEISRLAKGNAFLALDLNANGNIDNGSELFGTTSGNGFRDLAAYDEDGNGWIDENDSIYSKLQLWRPGISGQGILMNLKQGDIGALYLGAASTPFSLKDQTSNATQAVVRQTGIYLHESTGIAGAVQQIDLATHIQKNM